MQKRRLGNTDLRISVVGVGTAPMGSSKEWSIDWGPQSTADSKRAILEALDEGINWIDTAPFYGWGKSERIIGETLEGVAARPYVFTKCGTVRLPDGSWKDDLSPSGIRGEVESSRARLRVDRLDLVQCHSPDAAVPIEETWEALMELREEGKIRHAGVSNFPNELIRRAMSVGPVASTQNCFNILQSAESEAPLELARTTGIGFLSWGSLASGFLVDSFSLDDLGRGDFRRTSDLGRLLVQGKLEPVYRGLRRVASAEGMSMRELALGWILRQEGVTGAIVGVRNGREARELGESSRKRISPETASEIASIQEYLRECAD